ncbi:MAG: hypothetical protein QM736_01780, partial [Vicinamibacterales bacterium]
MSGIPHIGADDVRIDQAEPVPVLEEAADAGVLIGRMRAGDDLERCHLDDRVAEPRLVDHHRHRVRFEHRAREREIELFADAHGTGARAPPAANRVDLDVAHALLARRRGLGRRRTCERKEDQSRCCSDLSASPINL